MAKSDVSGIPDVDLSSVKADLEGQATEEKGLDLGQFKSAEDLLKSYKEIQGAFTKVSQENKTLAEQVSETQRLKEELDNLRQQQELSSYNTPTQTQKGFDESWMEDPEKTIAQTVQEQLNLARINDVLESEEAKSPQEFQERYAYADMLARNPQYANLSKTPAGVKRLFKEADKLREQQLKSSSSKALEHLFGETLDEEKIAKLKRAVFGDTNNQTNDAYMPDTSTSTKSGSDVGQNRNQGAHVDDAANRGDVDGVLDEMFKDILA
jgi:hypothetical protein